ncbi:threonine/serine ThrE exporter family protein [Corynebacterium fournieri]|uniref:threonine/serine ThrE exporter family protein n=1 Tax=Corynebacterium fournieri TaxID=1852390 RepID=UPI000A2EFF01|nr:threonine/serine exporter family protein [Corynebacterium fournieri]WJY97965.1 Inner membrane protein YjjP [Corynebacterium fournieri]
MIEHNPRMDAEANTCLRFGVLLLAAGASGYRVIRAVKRCARSVGFDNADVIVGFNTISCTFHRGEQFRTAVSDVPLPGVNASRIEALETAAHSLLQSYRTPEVISAALDEIERIPSPRWGARLSTLAAGLACAGFAVLNQFGWATAAMVCLAAMLGQLVRSLLHKAHFNLIGITMAAAFVASAAFLALARVLPLDGVVSPGFVAAVLFLIPGFPLFTSFVDLARFDFTAGIPRLFFALEIIVVIMLTVSVVAMLSGTPEAQPQPVPKSAEFLAASALASFVSVGCFALLFNSSKRMALIAATLGMAANAVRLTLLAYGSVSYLAAFAAALLIGVAGGLLGRVAKVPRTTVTIPAAVVMIPGPVIYAAVHNFAVGDIVNALSKFTEVSFVVLFIAGGLSVARMITDPTWAFFRYIDFDHELVGEERPINN